MARNIEIEIPHAFGTEKAMRRIRRRAEKLQENNASRLQGVEAEWGASTATIKVRALGQTLPAHIEVTDALAKISVSVPLLVAPFSGRIEAYLRNEFEKILI